MFIFWLKDDLVKSYPH